MKLIGMLELFFIISLGITFVLVLFLVYHFKHRISTLENKCDTMFEIINSVASELGQVRSFIQVNSMTNNATNNTPFMNASFEDNNESKINVILSDDDDISVSDYDSESDNDHDDESDEESDDESVEESDEESEKNNNEDSEHETDGTTVKVVNVEINGEIDNSVEDTEEFDNNNASDNDDSSNILLNENEDKLQIEKIEHHTLDDSSIASSISATRSISAYKRMTLPVLKSLVIEKGLISDPSKLRKQELIELIQSSNI